MLNFRLARPATIVDINRVDGLGALTQTNGNGHAPAKREAEPVLGD